jgi:hypothetical protein
MDELGRNSDCHPDAAWIGRKVRLAAKPEWGVGTVVATSPSQHQGCPAQRVTVDFAVGRRHVFVPPARLVEPSDEPARQAGWLDSLDGRTPGDRLRRLPDEDAQFFGSPAQRLAAIARWFAYDDSPESVQRWARERLGLSDPLSQWTRDELSEAFQAFCAERDGRARELAQLIRRTEGREALSAMVSNDPPGAFRERLSGASEPRFHAAMERLRAAIRE